MRYLRRSSFVLPVCGVALLLVDPSVWWRLFGAAIVLIYVLDKEV